MKALKNMIIIGAIALLLLAGCAETAPPEDVDVENGGASMEPEPAAEEPQAETVDVTLTEWDVELETSTVESGMVEFVVGNNGRFFHEFAIEGEGIQAAIENGIPAGESRTLEIELAPGTYRVYCPIPGHAERGMEATLVVS